ncbi:MAG TPA: hypothetical protein VN940_06345 [Candidatus Dormibacteraeota bacterium]|nr:hypothetical protein [Candidatus Dormibacteraeota bacterium]
MSLLCRRLLATLIALWAVSFAAMVVLADAPPPSTWVALKPLPHQGRSAIFALAVDPANNQVLIAGTSEGSLLRSVDGASTWTSVHSGKVVVTAIVFSAFKPGLVLAGTRGGGALVSRDDGATWSATSGLEGRIVQAFGFSMTIVAAGTDKGVFISQDGTSWFASGLANLSIDTLAVPAVHAPVRFLAGSDGPLSGGIVPMFQSIDGGATWSALSPAVSGTYIVKLAAGPLPSVGDTRPVIAGTNAGLFASNDNGVSFLPISAGGSLPATDYTQIAFITDHHDRFYAASDGGGSGAGGLWRTNDGGASFLSLVPPMHSITALAVSNDESPFLYVATFRPSDHVAALWLYRDTGGTPQGPLGSPTPVASGSRTSTPTPAGSPVLDMLASSKTPYIGLGVAALAVVLFAVVAHLRGRRR